MKFLTHDRDKVGDFQKRVLIHIPIGFLIGILSVIPFVGYALMKLFVRYEENEDLHFKDQAWKDYFGAIVGFVIASLVILAGFVLFVLKLLEILGDIKTIILIPTF